MNILDLARRHVREITGNVAGGFAVPATFIAPGGETVTGAGLHKKVWTADQLPGEQAINARTAAFSMAEQIFIDAGYPYRDTKGEVLLKGHKVLVKDYRMVYTYKVKEWFPDETLGLIVCILEDFE